MPDTAWRGPPDVRPPSGSGFAAQFAGRHIGGQGDVWLCCLEAACACSACGLLQHNWHITLHIHMDDSRSREAARFCRNKFLRRIRCNSSQW
jgi:hypothetical protein